jgi:outer membrane protein TolC
LVLEDDPAQVPPKSDILPFEQALEKAMYARPEVKAASQRLVVDSVNARAAKDALMPQLDLQVNGGSSGPSLNAPTTGSAVGVPATMYPGLGETLKQVFAFDFPSYGFGLTLNFPIHNSQAKASLADALVSRAQDRYRQRQTNQQVILSVRTAIDNIELAEAQVDTATTARDLARKNVDAEQQKYQLGSITAFELLDSQNRLANAESALVSAFVTYQEAYVAYQRATWSLLDGFGVIIDHRTP